MLDRVDCDRQEESRVFYPAAPLADPLYISNRTPGQKIRLGLLLGAPALAVGSFIVLALNNYSFRRTIARRRARTRGPAQTLPPNSCRTIDKNWSRQYSRDVEVMEAASAATTTTP